MIDRVSWRRLLGIAVGASIALSAAVALAASSNGVATESPTAIVAATQHAIAGVSSAHIFGSGIDNGEPVALNLYLSAGKGGRGSVTENGAVFQLVVIGKTLYFEGSAAFWKKSGTSGAETALLAGKWLKTPTTGSFASVFEFTNIGSLSKSLLTPTKGKLTRGAVTTVLGQQVVPITDGTTGGTLYVATTGQPYPVEIVNTTAGKRETLVINDIGQPVTLTAPAGAISISSIAGG
jgi:hypothetical protein